MSAQMPEQLEYKARKFAMHTQPLGDYFTEGRPNLAFVAPHTACRRGYIGKWKIDASRLYLVAISGYLEIGGMASLRDLFPGYVERVFAHWYTGTLRCPRGRLIKSMPAGYASQYQADMLFHVERGVVTGSEIVCNVHKT